MGNVGGRKGASRFQGAATRRSIADTAWLDCGEDGVHTYIR